MFWLIVLGVIIMPVPVLYRMNRMVDYVVERRRQLQKPKTVAKLLMYNKTNIVADSLIIISFYFGILPLIFVSSWAIKYLTISISAVFFFFAAFIKFKAVKENYAENGVP